MDHARFKANHTPALYVSGELDEESQEAFELHLMSCPKCVEDVEIWRAMRAGMRDERRGSGGDLVRRAALPGPWRIAASFALIAIGSGAAGWYGRPIAGPPLADDSVAVFNLSPVARGFEDCETLRVGAATEIIALRVPHAVAGWQLELTDEQGAPLAPGAYSVRTQADGSWLLRLRAEASVGEVRRLQLRTSEDATEPRGCVFVASAS